MGTFIRDFNIEALAYQFAAQVGGKVYVHYDYDNIHYEIIRIYRVKY